MPQPKDMETGALTEGEWRAQRRGEIAQAFELADPSGGDCQHEMAWRSRYTGETWQTDVMLVCDICDYVDMTAAGNPWRDLDQKGLR